MEPTISSAKLRFLCRRGMKETEEILQRFFDMRYENLTLELQQNFAALLDCEDTELWDWLVLKDGKEPQALRAIVGVINAA